MRLKLALLVILIFSTTLIDSKRSRSRSRGSSSSGSTFWNRKKSSDSKPKTQVSSATQPEIKKESAKVQQSAPTKTQPTDSGRPIGWNVDSAKKQNVNPSHTANAPPPYPQQNSGYGYNQHNTGYNQHNTGYNYGQQTPGGYNYGQHTPGGYNYGQHTPGGYNYGQHTPGGYNYGQHTPGGYNYGQHTPGGYNYGQHAPGGYPGGYPNHGYQPMGGYGGYSHQSGGLFGNKYGGFGGMGGLGGYGGYGMKKSGGFFGKHAFRNVLGGLFVWYLVSGLVRTPYKVYNYYNQPKEIIQQEITLPPNVLTLCNENATNICVPGTVAICTNDNRILCVTSMTSATPCQDNNGALCVNSTIPCIDSNDPLCQNKTIGDNTTTVNLPCFTNMTFEAGQNVPANITLPQSEDNKFCVTTMAVPDPSQPPVNVTEEMMNVTQAEPQIPINTTQEGVSVPPPPMWYPPPPMYWGYAPGFYPPYPPPYFGYPPTNITFPQNVTEISTTEVTTAES